MSLFIPSYLVGRNVSLMAAQIIGINADGSVSYGGTANLTNLGVFDSFEFEGDLDSEDIHAANATVENYVPKLDRFTITVNEIIRGDGYSNLMNIHMNYLYWRVAAQATAPNFNGGSGIVGNNFAAIGLRGTCRYTMVEGKNAASLTLKPSGIFPYWGSGAAPF